MWNFINNNIKLVSIDPAYTDYLRNNIDPKIPVEHNLNSSHSRAFIGVLLANDTHKYVIPLSSPKPKHLHMKNSIDFHKIDGGIYGAINFNNMFPIIDDPSIYTVLNASLDSGISLHEKQYRNLLRNQLQWLNSPTNKQTVIRKAENLYLAYTSGTLNSKVKSRCCNFIKLEQHYQEYKIK